MTRSVEAARWTDAIAVQAILAAHVNEAGWLTQTRSAAEELATIDQMIAADWVRVVRTDGRVQGFCAKDGDLIHAIYVDPAERGQGVGARLLDDAKAVQPRLRLWTAVQNVQAQRFYKRHGFAQTHRCTAGLNDECVDEIWLAWNRTQEDT